MAAVRALDSRVPAGRDGETRAEGLLEAEEAEGAP